MRKEDFMNAIEIAKRALEAEEGESVLGLADTGSHACYMIYGIVRPGETGRLVNPGKGHEEIVLSVRGALELTGAMTGHLAEGCAFHCAGDTDIFLENRGDTDAVYIIAGGHSEEGHHH